MVDTIKDSYNLNKLVPCLLDAGLNLAIGLIPWGGLIKEGIALVADMTGTEFHPFERVLGENLFGGDLPDLVAGHTGIARDVVKGTYGVLGGAAEKARLEKEAAKLNDRLKRNPTNTSLDK